MFKKKFSLFFITLSFISSNIYCQCLTKDEVYKKIFSLEDNGSLNDKQRLAEFYALKANAEKCNLKKDSVYAWIFLKLGKYEFIVNKKYEVAIKFTRLALTTNNIIPANECVYLNINAYFNLATYNEALLNYTKALNLYDSSVFLCKTFIDTNSFALDSRLRKANIYFSLGDYQKAIEESIKGFHLSEIENNLDNEISFLNMQAQSLLFENNIDGALPVAHSAAIISSKENNQYELATAYKTIALIYKRKNIPDSAKHFFTKAINTRLKTASYTIIASDYNDFANFYHGLADYKNAAKFYNLFLEYINKIGDPVDRSMQLSLAYLNIGENFFKQNKFREAEDYYVRSLNVLNLDVTDIFQNPSTKKLISFSSNAPLVIGLMTNKTKLLLNEFRETRKQQILKACLAAAFTTDSVITQIRHEHVGEQSKLYWRDKTSEFYADAIEACYYANDAADAFYFLEKSRAMLLNDKLNELSASSHLPQGEANKEENYRLNLIELERKLSTTNLHLSEFDNVQLQLINAKENFEQYIKSLETKYPAYYQSKYNDVVPSLHQLQSYLQKENENFIHFFMSDSVVYSLCVTPTSARFIQTPVKNILQSLNQFLEYCSDKQRLMNHYTSFSSLSYSLYKTIFQPLHLAKGRVIVCANNMVIPLDALCTNENGNSFLLNDYAFSYVYSAQFLLKKFTNPTPLGNFLGFAPVSFANYLNVQPLATSAEALKSSSKFYSNEKLFTNENATRNNFFKYVSSYSVVSIFSHAKGDTTSNEPVLFMHDSLIRLSELQLLNNPATRLVLLSACQTNVGKAANGEGIYSLARGFATAGIPSISATLWKADEHAIYTISEKFNQYLSEGMSKDDALQKAKLDFIQNNQGTEKLLPYYWANMILIGNTTAVDLSNNTSIFYWLIIAAVVVLFITALIMYLRKKRKLKFQVMF